MSGKKAQEYQQDGSNRVTEGSTPKPARLTLRNGVWYADGVPCADYPDALEQTLQTAAIPVPWRADEKLRLEKRPWWPLYYRARRTRLHLERARVEAEQAAAVWAAHLEKCAARIAERAAEASHFTQQSIFIKNVGHARPTFSDPPKSLTLRERFLAKAAGA